MFCSNIEHRKCIRFLCRWVVWFSCHPVVTLGLGVRRCTGSTKGFTNTELQGRRCLCVQCCLVARRSRVRIEECNLSCGALARLQAYTVNCRVKTEGKERAAVKRGLVAQPGLLRPHPPLRNTLTCSGNFRLPPFRVGFTP